MDKQDAYEWAMGFQKMAQDTRDEVRKLRPLDPDDLLKIEDHYRLADSFDRQQYKEMKVLMNG